MGKPTYEDLIASAIGWASKFPEIGVPDDLTEADVVVREFNIPRSAMESTGPLHWTEQAYSVTLRKTWRVELDWRGAPKDQPPQRVR